VEERDFFEGVFTAMVQEGEREERRRERKRGGEGKGKERRKGVSDVAEEKKKKESNQKKGLLFGEFTGQTQTKSISQTGVKQGDIIHTQSPKKKKNNKPKLKQAVSESKQTKEVLFPTLFTTSTTISLFFPMSCFFLQPLFKLSFFPCKLKIFFPPFGLGLEEKKKKEKPKTTSSTLSLFSLPNSTMSSGEESQSSPVRSRSSPAPSPMKEDEQGEGNSADEIELLDEDELRERELDEILNPKEGSDDEDGIDLMGDDMEK
jgi:hypothetical protein